MNKNLVNCGKAKGDGKRSPMLIRSQADRMGFVVDRKVQRLGGKDAQTDATHEREAPQKIEGDEIVRHSGETQRVEA